MKSPVLVGVLLAALLAGCTDDPSEAEPALPADASTGTLRGVVLDTTITPVEGANVTLEGYDLVATTNADGAFAFEGLAGGTYRLVAEHPGFNGAQTTAQVDPTAAKADIVRIVMQPKQTVVPFVQPYEWRGFIQCAYIAIYSANDCVPPDAGFLTSDTTTVYELEAQPTWVQSEMSWENSQLLGDALQLQYAVPDTNFDYLRAEGPSPVLVVADAATIDLNGLGAGLDLYLRVFPSHLDGTEPPAGDLFGVGLQFDQDFTVVTHVFYHVQPPTGWQFTADGDILPP